jgi:hypothetical protein
MNYYKIIRTNSIVLQNYKTIQFVLDFLPLTHLSQAKIVCKQWNIAILSSDKLFTKIKDNKISEIIQFIKNINKQQILNYNNIISKITYSNIDNNNSTACGTYANSLFGILSKESPYFKPYFKSLIKFRNEYPIDIMDISDINSYIKQINLGGQQIIIRFGIHGGTEIKLQNEDKPVIFPGHAFCIIKIYKNRYIFTQSYVDVYDHTHYIFEINLAEVLNIVYAFGYMIKSKVIDDEFVRCWNGITNVDIGVWKNGVVNDDFKYTIHKMLL